MPLLSEHIESLAQGTLERNIAKNYFTFDKFAATLAIKPEGGSNGSDPNDTYSWIDYNEKDSARNRAFEGEITPTSVKPNRSMVTLSEFGDTYRLDTVKNRTIPGYEAGQLEGATHSVRKGYARRFLFGYKEEGTEEHTGLVEFAKMPEYDRVLDTVVDFSDTAIVTKDHAIALSQAVDEGMGDMTVTPNVLYCYQRDLSLFLSAQRLLNQYVQPLIFNGVEFATFGTLKIVPLDLTEFQYEDEDGSSGTMFILARQDDTDGVFAVTPRDLPFIEIDLASEKKTGDRTTKGGVYAKMHAVPFNKKAFTVIKIQKKVL